MKRPSYMLLLMLASCTSSKLDSNATVNISGAARAQGGTPLAGASVVFYKQLDVGEVLTTALELTSSLGTVCLLNPSATSCAGVRTATTDAQGNFSFSLKGSDTQGTLGSASTLDVSVADAAQAGESAGATTTEQFQDQVSNLKLNDLRIWHPSTAFAVTGASVSLTFDSFPYAMATAGVTFQSNKGVPVWSQSAASGAAIDARLLEDTQGTVMVTAQMPVVTVAPNDALVDKLKSNMQEVRARGGELFVFADSDTKIESGEGLHVIRMPEHYGALSPILHVVPLQLLAYHTACARGTDVDKPRNLAKSVTVE